ncbi:acetate--CoA ligase family protein [Patescibacteria group bacterium]|nr:acetate--CoA ligase family protein [Patescibacteria group bacterium]
MKDFDKIFKARSVAIIGASNRKGSIGNTLVLNLKNSFKGKIYPVNLKEGRIENLKAYSSLSEIKSSVDLMLIAVSAKIVPDILEEGGRLGIKGAIVISAGFKEVGNLELDNRLKAIAKKYKITLIGPNCLGVLNPYNNLNASFASQSAKPGKTAFISQSGAVCTAVLDSAEKLGLGFSKFVSVGNKALSSEADFFEYLASDKEAEIVAVYAEELSEPERIIKAAQKLKKAGKPLIILKAGRSLVGAKSAASHTGALAGEDKVYQALFRQAGIIRADKIEELFDFIKIFSTEISQKTLKNKNYKNIAIITNAGGPGVIAVDALERVGLNLASLSLKTQISLKKILALAANTNNPIDVLGDALAEHYQVALQAVLSDKKVDSVLVILTPQAVTEVEKTAEVIVELRKKFKKTIVPVFMGETTVNSAREIFSSNSLAHYSFPEDGIKALGVLNKWNEAYNEKSRNAEINFKNIDQKKVEKIFFAAKKRGQKAFPELEALEILKAYGFKTLKSYLAKSPEEAKLIAKKINKNLVLKISSADILHKSDAGGIMLNVLPNEAEEKFKELIARVSKKNKKAKINGVLIMEMIKEEGLEMILGAFKDPALGSAIMLGLGGIFVEIFKDVSFGLNPLSKNDVYKMVDELKSRQLLAGARGSSVKDKEVLVDSVLRLAKLIKDFPEILELDINPLLVLRKGRGIRVLDARVIIC